MPRLHGFLPARTILELGPGFGRWTQFLKDSCDQLVVVDMAERCVEACRERFAGSSNITYHVNDGRSLTMVPNGSVDFAFSFDSLVHAERDVLAAYLEQLAVKLSPEGVGFIHHSNMGAYRTHARLARRVPAPIRPRLVTRGLLVNVYAWRAESLTADAFAQMCDEAGLACIGQETINWQCGRQLIDCLSLITRPESRWSRSNVRLANPRFMRDAASISQLAPLYTGWATRGRSTSSAGAAT